MNYKRHYDLLIQRSNNRIIDGYTESHHIIPKCLGGNDNNDNLVDLTPEEHYLAHQLLVKMYPEHPGLIYAAMMMTIHTTDNRMNNKLFGWLRRKYSESKLGKPGRKLSDETKQKISQSHIGIRQTPESIEKIKDARAKQIFSQESIDKRLQTRINDGNLKHTDNAKLKMSLASKGKSKSNEHKKSLSNNHWTKNPEIADIIKQKISATKKLKEK